jgi:hypothetical protein
VPEGDVFVGRRNVRDVVGTSTRSNDVFGLEATPSNKSLFDGSLSGETAFVHGIAGPSDLVHFRASVPSPLGGSRLVGSGERNPVGLVNLGREEGVLFVGSNSGEVTLHAEELVGAARVDCFLPGRGDVDKAVEVTSEVVVVGVLAECPSDAARLEVFSGSVEDDSGDGVEVLRERSSTDEEERTLSGIPELVDLEITLVVKEELVEIFVVVDFNTNGGTIDLLIIGSSERGERMDTVIRSDGDVLLHNGSSGEANHKRTVSNNQGENESCRRFHFLFYLFLLLQKKKGGETKRKGIFFLFKK